MQNDIVRQPPQPEETSIPVTPPATAVGESPPKPIDVITPAEPASEPVIAKQDEKPAPSLEQPTAEQAKVDAPPVIHKKSTKPIGIIVAAAVVFTGLAGMAVYAGLQSDSGAQTTASKPAQVQSPASQAAAPTDDTVKEADQAITEASSLQDPGQDVSSDLSDQSLGL